MQLAMFRSLLKQLYANKAAITSPFDPQISIINSLILESFNGMTDSEKVIVIEAFVKSDEVTPKEESPPAEPPPDKVKEDPGTIYRERLYQLLMAMTRIWIVRGIVIIIIVSSSMLTGVWVWVEFSNQNSWLRTTFETFKKMVKIWM